MMDLGTLFHFAVQRCPGAEAIVDGSTRRTYAAWYGEIRAVAGALRGMGLKRGDHLVVVMRNRYETASLYWAAHMLGLIFTPVTWRASADELRYCLEDAEAAGVAFDDGAGDEIGKALAMIDFPAEKSVVGPGGRGEGVRFESLLAADPIDGPEAKIDAEAACLMLYTSGTTGRPKGVPRSHRAEYMAGLSQLVHNRYRFGESAIGVMPMFHTMGVRIMLSTAMLNGKLVCVPDYRPERVIALIEEERISSAFLVPTMFHDILRHPDCAAADLSCLTHVGYAGMSMTTSLTKAVQERLRPEVFINFYGSSEIYTFSVCDHLDRKPGCAGRPGVNQALRIVSTAAGPDDIDATVHPGQTGEIIASMSSPEAFRSYWKRPDADRKALHRGWYRTGDLGTMDEDGELYVVGRVDDMIISGAENIYPEEVEDVLSRIDGVTAVAVIGLPDERLGQKVVACVEPNGEHVTSDALDNACLRSGLARFKRPREYIFVEALPRSASGKLLRRRLRETYSKSEQS
ncbi:class I adenylate-forming enzyme family protein [Rhodoligotrophos defluvii]|uniref:class I adenylate-forming enzyme family protein n=1 Tax=Rhodoligotrophos defluvii TaxID=2561934 RepID=UPI0010C9628E|nr:AMP-binding protein [Rhodoligotrophos defluvii]